MTFPVVSLAAKLKPDNRRIFIGAYGFEPRSLGWATFQEKQGDILNGAVMLRYVHPKGKNRVKQLRETLAKIGVASCVDIPYDVRSSRNIEDLLSKHLEAALPGTDEVVMDISAMTKLLILVCLCKLVDFTGTVRIVYSEADDYAPTQDDYEKSKSDMSSIAKFPSHGFQSIVRMKCLSSIRMQGQPVTMVAFTSFNEQLVRHMLGTINPHQLLFINGRPPRRDFAWRERATQEIHERLIQEYLAQNPIDKEGHLTRVASTLHYNETIHRLEEIYKQLGTHERIICAATGSKMQTVGLFFSKIAHPDIHIEYPTPDSYFVRGISRGVRQVHEIAIPGFSEFLRTVTTR